MNEGGIKIEENSEVTEIEEKFAIPSALSTKLQNCVSLIL